jgi:hypothetical protein
VARNDNSSSFSRIEEHGVHHLFKPQLYVAGSVIVDICVEMAVTKSDKHVRDGGNALFCNAFYLKTFIFFPHCFKPKMYGLLFALHASGRMLTVWTIQNLVPFARCQTCVAVVPVSDDCAICCTHTDADIARIKESVITLRSYLGCQIYKSISWTLK